ncbi:MAG: putative amidohydrolase [Candidatus Endobugula sp.]|jgi:predicted amidohydrolase
MLTVSAMAADNLMQENLSVALIQPDLHWLKPTANRDHLATLLLDIPPQTDIVVLPEMFTSGFTEKPELIEGGQKTITWMKAQATLHNTALVGSIACQIEQSNELYFVNRLLFVTPSGEVFHYDKCHLFQMGGEHERYRSGDKRQILEYKGWKLLLTICYDLRFPVFCRNKADYDAMICVANWPVVRRHPWRTLLQARAIENQVYVLGVNRVGEDGKDLLYNGDSMAVDFQGDILVDGKDGSESVLTTTLSMQLLQRARQQFPVWQDADDFYLS